MKHKRLGELLVERGLVSKTQLDHALARQEKYGGRLGTNLVKAGIISEQDLMRFIAVQTGIKEVRLSSARIDPKIVKMIPEKIAMQYMLAPVKIKDRATLIVACVDPTDLNALDEVSFITGHRVQPVLARYSDVLNLLNNTYAAVPLADNRAVHANESIDITGPDPGGSHRAIADPDLIIFGEQTLDKMPVITEEKPDSARPLSIPAPAWSDPDDEFTLDFGTRPPAGATVAPKKAEPVSFSADQKLNALINLLVKKQIIGEKDLQNELMRLWSLGQL